MLMKFPHPDTHCLYTFNSTKTTTQPPVGVSLKRLKDEINHNLQKHVLECPNGSLMSNKNAILKNPHGQIDSNFKISRTLGTKESIIHKDGKYGAFEDEMAEQEHSIDNSNGITQKKAALSSDGASTRVVKKLHTRRSSVNGQKNGVFMKPKLAQNWNGSNSGRMTENKRNGTSRMIGSGSVSNVQTNCSRKCAGGIHEMLEAVETTSDLNIALKPWEVTLTNKERTILLKEQLKWERAMEIFEWFKKKRCYEINVIHYNIMMRFLGKAHQWSEVERLWSEMGKRGIEPISSTYGTLIDVYYKGGLREKAMEWLELMNERKMEPDEVTMAIVVQMYKKAGDSKSAEDFFKKWYGSKVSVDDGSKLSGRRKDGVACNSVSNFNLSVQTYNTLIDTYGKDGKLREANETFEKMVREGITPTVVTFNSLIHIFGNKGQLGEVSSLMGRMEKVKCFPDTRTYNILISLHAKHNNIDLAAKYFKMMKHFSLEPDSVTYRTLLYAFAIRHMVSEAEGLVLEMDERGFEIDEYTQSSLTRMYIEAGLLEKSWEWFERFHLDGSMTPECYSANINAFGDRGYVSEAEKVFSCCLEVKKLSVLVFNVMIKAYGIDDKFDDACRLFDSMKKHGVVPDRCSYNSVVQMLASADLAERAKSYLMKMQDADLVIDCVPYSAVISSYVKLHRMDLAVGLYEEMIGYSIKPDVIVFGVLINGFADIGSVEEAMYYVNAMKNIGIPMNFVICKSLIKLHTKVGNLKEAEEAYTLLQSMSVSQDAYSANCMIDLYSERSMIFEAEKIFVEMKENAIANEFTYAMMMCMYRKNSRFEEAFGIARRMRELGFMTDLLSYNNVLVLYASDGRFREVATTFHEMQKSGIQPDDCTFRSLGNVLLKCGVPKDAIENLERTRKVDAHNGIRAWTSTLSSVIL